MVTVLLHDTTSDLVSDDGVLIQEEGSTKNIEAMWTTLVVINPPNELPIQAWFEEVRKGIQAVGSHVSAEDQHMWEARLQVLVHKGLVTNALLDRPNALPPFRAQTCEKSALWICRGYIQVLLWNCHY